MRLAFKAILALVLGVVLLLGVQLYFQKRTVFFQSPLDTETIKTQGHASVDTDTSDWETLSYGYQIGAWPLRFQGEPVVSTLVYKKGPPEKFIPEMKLIWSPVDAEVTIEGPRTPLPEQSRLKWKIHLGSRLFYGAEKRAFTDVVLADLRRYASSIKSVTWFEGENTNSPQGLHVKIVSDNTQVDRYVLFTEDGITQNFTLTSTRNAVGDEARALFQEVLGGMNAKNNLSEPRALIGKKLKNVQVGQIQAIQSAPVRYAKLIQVQNELFSQLAVDPRSIAPFFHLAGVVHLMGTSLIKEKTHYFKNQESWLVGIGPLLGGLVQYVKDFPDSGPQKNERDAALADMESLQEDFLLLEERSSQKKARNDK